MKLIVVYGGVLAATIAAVMRRISGISGTHRVVYVPAEGPAVALEGLDDCAVFLRQDPYKAAWLEDALPSGCIRISFPTLEVRHLWPLHCVNPYNQPEVPRYPAGRFPFGDSFVVTCLQQQVNPAQIVELCTSGEWARSWPDLEVLERDEFARLQDAELRMDVGMLPYIRENLQRTRLFWAPASPTNALLAELIVRLLDRAFAPAKLVSRKVLEELLHLQGEWELFGSIAVPIHPQVAKHFGLTWYDPNERYNYFGEKLSNRQYFERMVLQNGSKPHYRREDRRSLLVYGNCQAEALAVILGRDPTVTSLYEVRYVKSFGVEAGHVASEAVVKCAIFLEQHDRAPFPHGDSLPGDCTKIRFPSIDCNVLWPFNAVNPYDDVFPAGRFPYGDRVIIEQIDAGRSAKEILDYYLNDWSDYKVDLGRLLKLEIARFAARDAKCDVTMGAYLYERFTFERPLWTANHPTLGFLRVLLQRIVALAARTDERLGAADIGRTAEASFVLSPRGPLGVISVPVHPKVAEYFELAWYDPREHYRLADGTAYSYKGYFKQMIAHSIAKKMVAVH